MKLAIITTSFLDPSHNHIWEWLKCLMAHGTDVHIYTERVDKRALAWGRFRDPAVWKRVHSVGDSTRPLGSPAQTWLPSARTLASPSSLLHLVRVLAKTGRPARTVVRGAIEYLPWARENFDVVHFLYPKLAVRRKEFAEIAHGKMVVSFRGQDLTFFPGLFGPVFDCSDWVHFISHHLLEEAQRQGYVARAFSIIPPMVDVDFYRPLDPESRDVLNRSQGRRRILTAARLHWVKGFETVLSAIRALVDRGWDVDYYIAGDGDYRQAVVYTISDLGLEDRVHLLGWLSPEQLREWMRAVDLYVMGSVQEGFNNSVVQAQACGLPVVCTDAGGLMESIEDGVTGYVAHRRDAQDMAMKIEQLLSQPELLKQMSRKARERAVNAFAIERVSAQFLSLYERLGAV